MKKILLSVAFLLAVQIAFAQEVKFGIKAGVNFANQDFKLETGGVSISPSTKSIVSFHIAGLVDYGVSSNFSIQPGLSITGKGSKFEAEGATQKSDLMYIEIPVNGVAKFAAGSLGKFFIGAGPYAAFGVAGKTKYEEGNDTEEMDSFSDEGFKKSDFGLNLLGGLELSNGVTINANYGLGLSNIAQSSDDEGSIKNKVVSISLGFLF
jgi:hypothetical protein